jgi:hypothetical protein
MRGVMSNAQEPIPMEPAIRLAKRIVAYPENSVPSIFSRDYLGCFVKNPRRPVRSFENIT